MKLGICCSLSDAGEALEAGFDYVELSASEMAVSEDRSAYRGLPIEVTNLFFPGHIRLYDQGRPEAITLGRRTIEVAAWLGVRVMVIGSGGARRAPEGLNPHDAQIQFVDLVAELNEHASQFGIQLAPESLNRSETNVGNSLAILSEALADKGIGYTCDAYHVLRETSFEQLSVDWEAELKAASPIHVHLASRTRQVPEAADPDIATFFGELRRMRYEGRVSFEGDRKGLSFREAFALLSVWI